MNAKEKGKTAGRDEGECTGKRVRRSGCSYMLGRGSVVELVKAN